MKDIDTILEALSGIRLCVVGDLLLDEFVTGSVERISPEAPVPVFLEETTTYRASGVATAAQTAAGLCASVEVVTVTGDDEPGRRALALLEEAGARVHAVTDQTKRTPHKRRIIAQGQQLLRWDRETTRDVGREGAEAVIDLTLAALERSDALLISDYAKGTCTEAVLRPIIEAASRMRRPVVVDPKNPVPDRYAGATAITPNVLEMRAFARHLGCGEQTPVTAAKRLRAAGGFGYVVLTQDADGMTVVGARETIAVPSYSTGVVDVAGAGDAVAAVLALSLAAGLPVSAAATVSSVVAGLTLRTREHKRVEPGEVRTAAEEFGLGLLLRS